MLPAEIIRTKRDRGALGTPQIQAFVQGLVTADDVPALRVSGIFKIGPPFNPNAGDAAGPR